MSKRNSAVRRSPTSSWRVRRSIRSVARPARTRISATNLLRGLCRLLPLPWAKTTIAPAPTGIRRSPSSSAAPAGTVTDVLVISRRSSLVPFRPICAGGSCRTRTWESRRSSGPAGSSCAARRATRQIGSTLQASPPSSAPRRPWALRRRPHRGWQSRRRPRRLDASTGWLSWRHLVSLVLDQLLEAIHDIEVAVRVGVADVAGVQPAIVIENLRGGGRVVEIALHHLGTANQDLAVGLRTERFSGGDVDHLAFAAGHHGANRSDLYPFDVVAHQVRLGTGFGHAVTLVDLAVEALATSLGQVLIQGRGAGKDQGH